MISYLSGRAAAIRYGLLVLVFDFFLKWLRVRLIEKCGRKALAICIVGGFLLRLLNLWCGVKFAHRLFKASDFNVFCLILLLLPFTNILGALLLGKGK